MSESTSITASASSSEYSSADEWDLIPIQPGSAELSVEAALLWCLNPAIHGIRSIGVLPAVDRARRLVEMSNGDTTAAVVMAAGGETGGAKRTRIIFEFLLRQVPFIGCPAYILTSTWTHLRAVATIAAIYGHDLERPRTQHEILWCLLPNNPDSDTNAVPPVSGGDTGPVAATAKAVSQVLISTAIKKTVGITMVSELFQLGTDLWSVGKKSSTDDEEDDGFEHLTLGPSATARHYFCPDTQFSSHRFLLTVIGVIVPWLFRLPTIISTTLVLLTGIGYSSRRQVIDIIPPPLIASTPKLIAYLIFATHGLLPVLGISNGLSLLVPVHSVCTAERISLIVLGTMSLTAGLRAAGIKADIMNAIHVEVRKIAIFYGIVAHVLPFLDRSGQYTSRIAWLLSDTQLSSAQRSLHYVSILISSTTQPMLVAQLKRRDVILRLLGAERILILSMTLFFRGITAAISNESLAHFFRQLTPAPIFCCSVMVLRQYPLEAAATLTILPLIPVLVPSAVLSMGLGLIVGVFVVATVWNDYTCHESMYTSQMRLLFLLPGVVADKTKQVMDSMLKASGRTAIKTVLTNLAKNLSNRVFYRKIE